ncbi:MAG: hypothetical protein AAF638_00130 [Pseudomonadota bacterium]
MQRSTSRRVLQACAWLSVASASAFLAYQSTDTMKGQLKVMALQDTFRGGSALNPVSTANAVTSQDTLALQQTAARLEARVAELEASMADASLVTASIEPQDETPIVRVVVPQDSMDDEYAATHTEPMTSPMQDMPVILASADEVPSEDVSVGASVGASGGVDAPGAIPPTTSQALNDPLSGLADERARLSETSIAATMFGLDLGATGSLSESGSAWGTIAREHADVLGDLTPRIVVRDTNDGDLELRIIAGPVKNAADAIMACARLNARGQNCASSLYDGQLLSQNF